jgi:hypothetical protein
VQSYEKVFTKKPPLRSGSFSSIGINIIVFNGWLVLENNGLFYTDLVPVKELDVGTERVRCTQ